MDLDTSVRAPDNSSRPADGDFLDLHSKLKFRAWQPSEVLRTARVAGKDVRLGDIQAR